jgi:predicted transcriptional regulator
MNETVHQFTLGLHKEYQRASTTLVSGNNAFEDLRAEPPHKTSQGSEAESTRTTLYQKDVYFDTDNFVMFLISEDNGTTKASAVVSFDGNDPSREAALLSTLSMFFLE